MKEAVSRQESWDFVILNPPKLAPRRKGASGMYRNLNSLAIPVTKREGAASMASRKVTVFRQSGAACDHPIDPSYPAPKIITLRDEI
ncbi:hypothetical protein IFM89_011589 [Coptis chinensis]|uniref:Uncharacterized protein n=1 Tax=Coptis chinensis TaxID=261450 RepID=A0A835H2H6_9MAGN|nr:hypothetical protein IFM89_011589 [Coptis chinensis]